MNMEWDLITLVNLVLCIVALAFGIIGWRRSGKAFPLYVGIAFGLFGLSHLATFFGMRETLETVLVITRMLAYVLVAFALYQVAF